MKEGPQRSVDTVLIACIRFADILLILQAGCFMYAGDTAAMATGNRTEWVDSHVHVWTDDRTKYPRKSGALEYAPVRFTPDDFLCHARLNGVTRAVLVQVSFYGTDNSYLLDSIRAHPGVFSGIAIIDHEVENAAVVMAELAQQGIRGFRILPKPSGSA